MITRIEGRELKTRKCVKGWAGWTPVSDAEKAKFQELVLCPRDDHKEAALRDAGDGEGLVLLHERLVSAAAEVKATTTSTRNRNKFCAPGEIRSMASEAAKCQNPVRKNQLRRIVKHEENSRQEEPRYPGEGDKQACGHEALGQRTCQRGQRRVGRRGQSPL